MNFKKLSVSFSILKILKIILILIGSAILINGIALFFVSNFNIGNCLTVVLGVGILAFMFLWHKITKYLKIIFSLLLSVAVIFVSTLIIYGKTDNVTYKENAVVVLGAAVHGTTPSLPLRMRLNRAVEYYNENPNTIIVVSGGQGTQESITEAEAMQKYLVEKGIPSVNILKEENAESTYQNFEYSKQILDEYFKADYTITFITNDYHILRSAMCAEKVGFENATHFHSNTSKSYLISGTLRECLAVLKYIILKN